MPPIPYKKTPTKSGSWDAGTAEKNLRSQESDLRACFAWVDPEADPNTKGAYKFPHHFVATDGTVGDASISACHSAISVLNGGMGGADIPDADKQGVYDHVAHHLKDAGITPAELKSAHPRTTSRSTSKVREQRVRSVGRLELRSGDAGSKTLVGYASVTDAPYVVNDWLGSFTETIRGGAFGKSLKEQDDVRLLINHDGLPLARTKSGTLTLEEDNTGLRVEADLDHSSPLVQQLASAMQRGDLDQMSFAFQATRQEWNADYSERTIVEAKLFDVSVVTYPASPSTSASLRGAVSSKAVAARISALANELRLGKMLSAANTELLSELLDALATIDDLTDAWQPKLAALLGVPNPDDDDDDKDDDESNDEGRSMPLDLARAVLELI